MDGLGAGGAGLLEVLVIDGSREELRAGALELGRHLHHLSRAALDADGVEPRCQRNKHTTRDAAGSG